MWKGAPLATVLRLMALLSASHLGVPRKAYDALRSELLVTYGHQHLATLNNLERAGGWCGDGGCGGRGGVRAGLARDGASCCACRVVAVGFPE
jgi:hypothetical protein